MFLGLEIVGSVESSKIFQSSDGKFSTRFTDITDSSASALLTISDATADDFESRYICNVSNNIGSSEATVDLESGIISAQIQTGILAGTIIIFLLVIIALVVTCLWHRQKARRHHHVINENTKRLSPDMIGHPQPYDSGAVPPAFNHPLDHREVNNYFNCLYVHK